MGLLEDVDHEEKCDPDDVDKVPVIRGDNGAGGLIMSEALAHVGGSEHEEEGHQTAGYVQTVETSGEVEGAAIRT